MRAIVLSGGGSKGSYQIGVWKALKKLHIKYDIVTGTSVGALNAALMTQGTYFKAVRLWKHISYNKIIDNEIGSSVIKSYAKGIIKGGMGTTSLEKTVEETLCLNKLYRSKINMGIITFNVKKMEPLILTKKDIPKNKLKDYLVASASCFPAFKQKDIDNTKYIDGGYFDNLPINLATQMGADEVIAVDLKEIGRKRKIENKNVKVKIISPRNDIGSFLVFDSDISRRAIRLGYNDTLKEYGKLDGDKYTFKKNHLLKNYNRYKNKLDKTDFNELSIILEKLGYMFNIDDSKIYNINNFNKLLINEFKKIPNDKKIKDYLKENELKKANLDKYMVKYIYNDLNNKKLKTVFKTEYKCALYMHTIMEEL